MSKVLDEIVADLISFDPEFAKIEKDIRVLAQKMLVAKPHSEIDASFKKRLKNELLARAAQLKSMPSKSSFNPFKMQKFFYSLAGAAVALAVLFGVQNFNRVIPSSDSVAKFTVQSVAPRAFGSLAAGTGAVPATGRGGGGGAMTADSKIAPDLETYKYVYRGTLNLPSGEVEVLRRVKNSAATASLANSLAKFDFGLLDMSALQNVQVQNYNIVEDRDFGYAAFVNFEDGSVSLNQNSLKWPNPYLNCTAPDCYESLRLGRADMLSDAQILAAADELISQFKVNLKNYGAPEIIYDWQSELARFTGAESDFYFPESASVIYPLQVENKFVYNSSGDKEGLSVNVDQRSGRATNLYGLATQDYESSKYAAVTDEALFRKFLERGGLWWGGYLSEGANVVEIELGQPEQILLKYWNYANGASEELILPALRFPVISQNPNIYQKSVVVPLVAEILEQQDSIQPPILFREDVAVPVEAPKNEAVKNESEPSNTEGSNSKTLR